MSPRSGGLEWRPSNPKCKKKRIDCVHNVRGIVAGSELCSDDAESFSKVKGLFSRIHKQDQWDWFTVFEQMGCPGRKKSKEISAELSHIRKVIVGKSDANFYELVEKLKNHGIEKHLELFLNPNLEEVQSEKIYILSTREQRDFLKIGFTTR
ncbi:MAG: hypothetical protein CMO98_05580 [Woeseia sp.]|nr:hypothetical protein [Woeseia sp.]